MKLRGLDLKSLKLAFCAMTLGLTSNAAANEITETLQKPIRAVLSSTQSPADLEFCVADAITQIGGAVPVPIRNGGENVLMLGYGHTPKIVISLNALSNGTRVEVRTKSGDMDDKIVRSLLESCKSMSMMDA